jgi:hypothetical protein
MKIKILLFVALLIAASLTAGSTIVSGNVLSNAVNKDIQSSDERTGTLGRLALSLSSGAEATRNLRGSQSENNQNKDRLDPPMVGLECHIDRIASYVSCYSSPIPIEEAEALFSRLVDQLRADLPSNTWRAIQKEPGTAAVRSYTFRDEGSNAHVAIDILAQAKPQGPNSYIISIFGWPGYKLPGP